MQQVSSNMRPGVSLGAKAASTDTHYGEIVDMQNFEGCLFLLQLGAVTAGSTVTLDALGGDDSGDADVVHILTGSAVADGGSANSNRLVILDIFKPLDRYIRPRVSIADANAVVVGMIAIPYGGRKQPSIDVDDATQDVAAFAVHPSPARAGTTDAGGVPSSSSA